MPAYRCIWTDEALEKLSFHEVTVDEFEYVVQHPQETGNSRSSGLPTAAGFTLNGRWLFCVYEDIDGFDILPITAYEPRTTT